MDAKTLNKILGITKLQYGDKKPWDSKHSFSNEYDFDIPRILSSMLSDDDFFRALIVHNKETYDRWGKLEDSEVKIPELKSYRIETTFSGSEAVRRTYSDEVEAYDEKDLESRLDNCDPCWDEGEEIDVEQYERNGDWEISSIEQITEEDINRIVKKIINEVNDDDASPSDNKDLCDELTIDDLTELKSKMRGMNISKEDMEKINGIITKMNKETDKLSSDLDVANTNLRLIQNIICTYSKEDSQNIDEEKINRIVKKILK